MYAVRYMADWDVVGRPTREERLKERPANLSVERADGVHCAARTDGEVSHVERLEVIVAILPAKGQKIGDGDAEMIFGIRAEVLCDQFWREAVESGRDGGMGGENIADPCCRQSLDKRYQTFAERLSPPRREHCHNFYGHHGQIARVFGRCEPLNA